MASFHWAHLSFPCRLMVLISTLMALSTVLVSSLECEYYNVTECGLKVRALVEAESCNKSRKTVTCNDDPSSSRKHTCWVSWHKRIDSPNLLAYKGCFINNKQCNNQTKCTDKSRGKRTDLMSPQTVTLFCCCAKDNCNKEFDWDPAPLETMLTNSAMSLEEANPPSLFIAVGVPIYFSCILVVAGIAFFVYRRLHKNRPVKLVEAKAKGKFGQVRVWKASMTGKNNYVAIKVFPFKEKASWELEQEVYSLPLMRDSEWILRFFGTRERHFDGYGFRLWLISEYAELGSLHDYLKRNVLGWTDLVKVATSMCQGLEFLHQTEGYKPAVVHGDFKSKNVLLRGNLTSCVAGFKLARIFYPTKPIQAIHNKSGTLRYQAPEVLEESVSFSQGSFQGIDMYACGLVLWELASRLADQQGPIADYRLPFEEFIGQQPTLKEMKKLVIEQKKRPTIKNEWRNNTSLNVLVGAMEDAWDQHEEARIFASCIVKRLTQDI